jgi:hypothetical protein
MASSIAQAVSQLGALADGTPLAIGLADGRMTLTAPGMSPIAVSLPLGGLTVGTDLRDRLSDIAMAAADTAEFGDELSPDGYFWLSSAILAAGESGVSL